MVTPPSSSFFRPLVHGFSRLLLVVCLMPMLGVPCHAQTDPLTELSAFSVFQEVGSDPLAAEKPLTKKGTPMGLMRGLSVQSLYLLPLPLEKSVALHQRWNGAGQPGLKVRLHRAIPAKPSEGDFGGLLKPLPEPPATGESSWSRLLQSRALAFLAGGVPRQPAYPGNGEAVQPAEEIARLLKEQPKLATQFKPLLDETALTRATGTLSPTLYFEQIEVEKKPAFTLGATYSKPAKSGWQMLDAQFYASDGYYVMMSLYQFWPVKTGSGNATLVWRGDLLSSPSLAELRGMERLGSTGVMMKEIQKQIAALLKEAQPR